MYNNKLMVQPITELKQHYFLYLVTKPGGKNYIDKLIDIIRILIISMDELPWIKNCDNYLL